MTAIITRMPSTGDVVNLGFSERSVADLREIWADSDCVEVLSDEQFATLPRCETCGGWVGLRRCDDCR